MGNQLFFFFVVILQYWRFTSLSSSRLFLFLSFFPLLFLCCLVCLCLAAISCLSLFFLPLTLSFRPFLPPPKKNNTKNIPLSKNRTKPINRSVVNCVPPLTDL